MKTRQAARWDLGWGGSFPRARHTRELRVRQRTRQRLASLSVQVLDVVCVYLAGVILKANHMTEPKPGAPFDPVAFHQYMDELCEYLSEDHSGEPGEDGGVRLDGSFCDWDDELKAVVQTTADGRRYVVESQNGQIVRVRELVSVAG